MTHPPLDFDGTELAACHAWLLRLARGLARDEDEARDLVQETWLHTIRRRGRDVRDPRAFLRGMLRLLAVRRRSDGRARRARERLGARPELLPGVDELVERLDLARAVVEEIAALGEPQRSLLLLRYQEQHTPAAIAAARGIPPGTVRAQLSRARQSLRERLDRRFEKRGAWIALALGRRAGEITPLPGTAAAAVTTGLLMSTWMKASAVAGAAMLAWWMWPSSVAQDPETAELQPAPEASSENPTPPAVVVGPEHPGPTETRAAVAPPTLVAQAPAAPAAMRMVLRDARTAEPLPYYQIDVSAGSGALAPSVSDGAGEIEWNQVEPGDWQLTAIDDPENGLVNPQHVTITEDQRAQEWPLAVDLLAGPTYFLDFPGALPPGRLEVWVDESEQPFDQPGRGWGRVRKERQAWVRLDPSMVSFSTGAVGPWTLTVRDEDGLYLATGRVDQIEGVQQQPVNLRERRVGAVEVEVTLGGEPIDQRLALMVVREAGSTHSVNLEPSGRGYAPNKGRVRLGHLAEGACTLVAGSQGHGWTRVPCEIVAGETREVLIDVPRVSEVGRLTVACKSESGKRDLGGLRIMAMRDGAMFHMARFGKRHGDGAWEYVFEDLAQEDWTIRLEPAPHLPPFEARQLVARPGQPDVEFLCLDAGIGPGRWYEVVVLDEVTLEPLPYIGVTVYAGGGRHAHHMTDEEGLVRVGPYLDGIPLEILARGESYRTAVAKLVPSGELPPIEMRLREGWGTRLDVVESGSESMSQPIEGVRILCDGLEVGVTDARGRFLLELDRPPLRIELEKPGYRYVSGDIDPKTFAPPMQGVYPFWLVMKRRP